MLNLLFSPEKDIKLLSEPEAIELSIEAPDIFDAIIRAGIYAHLLKIEFDAASQYEKLVRTISEENGPWIVKIDDRAVQAIAALDYPAIEAAMIHLQSMEEVQTRNYDLYGLIKMMERVVKGAQNAGPHGLFVMMTL